MERGCSQLVLPARGALAVLLWYAMRELSANSFLAETPWLWSNLFR
jgi:hypothetical protein